MSPAVSVFAVHKKLLSHIAG